jgi:hypothetical protein
MIYQQDIICRCIIKQSNNKCSHKSHQLNQERRRMYLLGFFTEKELRENDLKMSNFLYHSSINTRN